MRRSRFGQEQIIAILREHEADAATSEVWRRHGISDGTFYRWKAKYGDTGVSDAKRLKAPGLFAATMIGGSCSGSAKIRTFST
jgi:putative transposase